jgi:hypothetical protein
LRTELVAGNDELDLVSPLRAEAEDDELEEAAERPVEKEKAMPPILH